MRWIPLRFACLTLAVAAAGPTAAAERRPPNVVVILADDVGYGDLGCYGATKVKTPNLDRLAAQGLRFTDAHSPSAMCTPTRYSLLTGQYAWRHPPGSRILTGTAPLCIPADRLTLPQLLQKAGYATGVVGKWHLGLGDRQTDYNAEIKPGPKEVGFGTSFIIPATGDRVPCVYVADGKVVGLDPKDPIRVSYREKVGTEPTGAENPDRLINLKSSPGRGHTGTIVNGIGRIGWMTGGQAARWKDEDMADVLTKKAVGFIADHKDRPFFLYFATHDIHAPRFPHARFRGTSGHGLRGDAIHQLDGSVGEVLAALDKHHLADNTLVLFSSDNGGTLVDGYQDGATEDRSGHKCNRSLRGRKGEVWEGGHRVPFIARWPGKVPAGKTSAALVCLVDVMATAAALVGSPLPPGAAPDSFDLTSALFAETPARPIRDTLVMHSGGTWMAVRQGDWVLVPPRRDAPGARPQLFNLADDLAQQRDLAPKYPERVKALAALLEAAKVAGGTRRGWSN